MMLFFVYYYVNHGDILAESKIVNTSLSIEEYEKSDELNDEIKRVKKIIMRKYEFDDEDYDFDDFFVCDYWIF